MGQPLDVMCHNSGTATIKFCTTIRPRTVRRHVVEPQIQNRTTQ